jgi:hypothetical protein
MEKARRIVEKALQDIYVVKKRTWKANIDFPLKVSVVAGEGLSIMPYTFGKQIGAMRALHHFSVDPRTMPVHVWVIGDDPSVDLEMRIDKRRMKFVKVKDVNDFLKKTENLKSVFKRKEHAAVRRTVREQKRKIVEGLKRVVRRR